MKIINELDKLALKYNTDKSSNAHNYTEIYNLYFHKFKDLKFNLLEIGTYDGASLRMWKEFFPNATIVSLDIDSRCKVFEEERIHIYIGSQTNEQLLNKIIKEHNGFDVIIDDGGHTWNQQIKSFETLFPLLNYGGIYFIEDLHTSYVLNGQWNDYNISCVEFLKGLVDDVNIRGKSFMGYHELGNQKLNFYENNIDYIHFYKSLSVIGKKHKPIQ